MAHQLLKIVEQLVHSRGLRAQFNQDPEAFMDRFSLSANARTALYTMNPGDIGKAIGDELWGFSFDPNEFPKCAYGHPLQEADLLYPSPKPETFAVVPERVAASDRLEISVWGQSFPNDAEVHFDPPLTQYGQRRAGTYRCCEIIVTLRSPAADVYTVSVQSGRLDTTIGSNGSIQLTLT